MKNNMWKQNILYITSKEDDKLIITADVSLPVFNKIVLTLLSVIIIPVTLITLWSNILAENASFLDYIFSILFSAIFLAMMYFSYKSFRRITRWIFTVDKTKQTIESDKDQFLTSFKDIKELKITENVSAFFGSAVPLFKFTLANGEKTLLYPLESYNRASELKKLIDEAIK